MNPNAPESTPAPFSSGKGNDKPIETYRGILADESPAPTVAVPQAGLVEELARLRVHNHDLAALQASIADLVNTEARECGAVESPNYQAENIKACVQRIVDKMRHDLAAVTRERDYLKDVLDKWDIHPLDFTPAKTRKELEADLATAREDAEKLRTAANEVFRYLDIVEESDEGREFHPISFGCCRAMMVEPFSKALEHLKTLAQARLAAPGQGGGK